MDYKLQNGQTIEVPNEIHWKAIDTIDGKVKPKENYSSITIAAYTAYLSLPQKDPMKPKARDELYLRLCMYEARENDNKPLFDMLNQYVNSCTRQLKGNAP